MIVKMAQMRKIVLSILVGVCDVYCSPSHFFKFSFRRVLEVYEFLAKSYRNLCEQKATFYEIDHLPSSLVPLFQNESKCETLFYENEFDLHENESAGGTHFHMNGFALRLVLRQKHKRTRKLPIHLHCFSVL